MDDTPKTSLSHCYEAKSSLLRYVWNNRVARGHLRGAAVPV
jgi:hypothetical protein